VPIPSGKAEDAKYSRMYYIKSRGCVVSLDRIIQKFCMCAAALTCRLFYTLRMFFQNSGPRRSNDMKMMDCLGYLEMNSVCSIYKYNSLQGEK